jgi:hypothetical protein
MSRFKHFAVASLLWLACATAAYGQASVSMWCFNPSGSQATNNQYVPCSSTTPLQVAGSLALAGTTSNASSGVATSSTNLPTVSYNYGFNGTTWDQLQVDASKSLKVNVATANAAVGITPTDHTITSASGSSQQIMAANASRHSMTIENTGNANCGVNPTGGTAAIGGAGTITLAPLGAYTPRVPTLSAVTVICTAGQPIYGDDN